MEFRKYEKIYRLGKEETDGILQGTVNVTEKLDGANLSVWLGERGEIRVGSRNNDLTANGNEFNGAVHYCNAHEGIRTLLAFHPTYRLYGEWLVRHTLAYNETAYKKFYLFDIFDHNEEKFLEQHTVQNLGTQYKIDTVPNIGEFNIPTLKELTKLVEGQKSVYGEKREGIVIRNPAFVNTFGDKCNAKIVSEGFMEDNGITFGGNNKYSEAYWEQYVSNKYITLERVQKIMNKIQPEVNKRLDMEHIPRITSTVYHDMLTEEAWEIAKNVKKLDYDVLKRICMKKAKQVFVDIITGQISVADKNDNSRES